MTLFDTAGLLTSYDPGGYYCELVTPEPECHSGLGALRARVDSLDLDALRRRTEAVTHELFNLGITFTVYTDREQIDRILPFDPLPRPVLPEEWAHIENGVIQRLTAINRFLWDIYHDQAILADGVVPADLVRGNDNFREEMVGVDVPHGTYSHICGVDLVRGGDGAFYVLEDNARTPSGVSYVVENRHLTLRAFPDLARGIGLRPVSDYGQRLAESLLELAEPMGVGDPQLALLSPGPFNSAYFEHIFLAREMGVPLVEGRDLLVRDDKVYMRTIEGLAPVHVLYRRLDDAFLDPEAFRPDSMLGVPGLMRAYRAGNVALANAVGTGVADDKAIYAYMPRIVRYYLGEEPILPNVETHICRESEGLAYTLDNLDKLVVKPVGESGGYGVVIGPRASEAELAETRARLRETPERYISQPMVALSVAPTLTEQGIAPRHLDLRPFAVTGKSSWVLPGGLTRVALREGSLIVNSSQGGGSKDTWVLE